MKKATTPGGETCVYRTTDPVPLSCAVGCLIPDEMYKSNMEYQSILNLQENFPEIKDLFGPVNKEVLIGLQKIHDQYDPKYWADQLQLLASNYDLVY